MAINIKPLVLNKDNKQFKCEWQAAVQESEAKLMQTVKNHLSRVITQTQTGIRQASNETYKRLKTITDKNNAKAQLERVLKLADDERRQKTEQRLKRKRELNDKTLEKTAKKTKPDD